MANNRINGLQLREGDIILLKRDDKGSNSPKEITVREFRKQFKIPKSDNGVQIFKGGLSIGTRSSLNLIEGANVTLGVVDDVTNNRINITVSAVGGASGGQVDSVVSGTGISVNSSDPINPIVNLNSASIASLLLADSAVQLVSAGTNVTVDNADTRYPIINAVDTIGLESVVAGTNISVNNTDPLNPIISSTATGGGENLNETLIIGNETLGEDIVVSDTDVIDFTAAGILTNVMTFPSSGYIKHIAGGVLDFGLQAIQFSLPTGVPHSKLEAGLLQLGTGLIYDGVLRLNSKTNFKYFEILTTTITDNRTETKPNANITWTGGSTGYVMTQQADGSFIPAIAGGGSTPLEEAIIGTAIYDSTLTGTENLDLSTFSSLYGILTGNTTITVSNTPSSGESFTRSLKIKSTTTETLTLPVTWKVIGSYVPDGSLYDFQIEFTNFPTVGLFVLCYINKIP